jgi:hypothetical protein
MREKSIKNKNLMIDRIQTTVAKIGVFTPIIMAKITSLAGNFQGHFTHFILSLKSLKNKKFNFKGFICGVWSFIKYPFVRLKSYLDTLRPSTIWTAVVLVLLTLGSSFGIWHNSENLYTKIRGPASVEKVAIGERPDYYKKNEKHFTIFHLRMPLYIESIHNPKQVKIDFTVEPSNRYVREYFLENEYLIHDRLNTMIQPVIPGLPLSEEGKQILKDKLFIELNKLIKDQKIKGEIKEVYINSILAV